MVDSQPHSCHTFPSRKVFRVAIQQTGTNIPIHIIPHHSTIHRFWTTVNLQISAIDTSSPHESQGPGKYTSDLTMPASPLLDCFGLPSRLLAMLTTAKIANVMYLVIQFIKHLKAVLLARFSKPRRYLTQYAQVALWNEWPSQLPLNHKRNHKRTQSLSYTASLQWPKYAKITKIHFLKDLKFLKVDFSRNGLFRTCSGLYSPGFSGSSGGPLGSWKVTIRGSPGYKMKSSGKCHSPCMLARFA